MEDTKPTEQEMIISKDTVSSRIKTAVIVKLYSSWGILRNEDGDILFRVGNLFLATTKLKVRCTSLLKSCLTEAEKVYRKRWQVQRDRRHGRENRSVKSRGH